MFNDAKCRLPQGTKLIKNKNSNYMLKKVLEEGRRVGELHELEIRQTIENPRIQEQNDLSDIARQLKSLKDKQTVEEKRRQQLRENNEELRLLEIHLRAAFNAKQLVEQRNCLDDFKKDQRKKQREEEQRLEAERRKTIEIMNQEEIENYHKKLAFRGVLLDQMAELEERRRQEYAEKLKDRENMKQLLIKLDSQHAKEMDDLKKRKMRAKEEIEEFTRVQDEMNIKLRAEKKDENKEFLEMTAKRDEAQRLEKIHRKEELAKKQALSEEIGRKLFEIESEKRVRENLLLDLLVEERKAKEDLRHRNYLEKIRSDQKQVRLELNRYRLNVLAMKDVHERQEEERFCAEINKIETDRANLEKKTEEIRRNKLDEHRFALLEMIEDRRRRRIGETTENMNIYLHLINEERKRDQEIEDERIRLLQSQPPEVLRYLPGRVLRNNEIHLLTELKKKEVDKKDK